MKKLFKRKYKITLEFDLRRSADRKELRRILYGAKV